MSPSRPRAARGSRRRGTALVVTIIFLLLLGATAATIATVTRSQSLASADHDALGDAMLIADNGLAKARVILERDLTSGATYKSITLNSAQTILDEDGALVTVTRLESSASEHTFRLRSVGSSARGFRRDLATGDLEAQTRTAEIIIRIEEPTPSPLAGPGMGAIVANGNVSVTGNIDVDGNDYTAGGTLVGVTGTNVPAITTTGTVSQGGSSALGGSGQALGSSYADGVTVDNATTAWDPEGNATGNSGDNSDGVDNDGDGVVDEDGFPDRIGGFFGMTDEAQLKAKAQADGTYFRATGSNADLSAYDAWLNSTSESQRGGKIVFIEVDDGAKTGEFKLPSNPQSSGASPTLVIVIPVTATANTIEVGPVHVKDSGTFQGVLAAGGHIKNMNGNGRVLGSIVAMDQATVHKIGNGNIDIHFSSEVVRNLPGVDPTGGSSPPPELLLWREVR